MSGRSLLDELMEARNRGASCALVTVARVQGSVPRKTGAKMIVYPEGTISGTVGGGKFESLVIETAMEAIRDGEPVLKTFTLREDRPDSFGAICGGEVTVFIEPQSAAPHLGIVGAGHCAQAIAELASKCGFAVSVADDRKELLGEPYYTSSIRTVSGVTPAEFVRSRTWGAKDALVMVSRNFLMDREALAAALEYPEIGYIGMIGSRRKVRRVYDELAAAGIDRSGLERVFAPIGLDIAAESPAEIAVSVVAEILQVLRGASGKHLKIG